MAGDPFPHIVIDGLFADEFLRVVHREFDTVGDAWRVCSSDQEKTWRSTQATPFGPATTAYFDTVHRREFVDFISAITKTPDLVIDHSLHGGGMHECRDGGWFAIHRDFNRHPRTLLSNEMVLLTYLNEDWNDDLGGALELWCDRRKQVVRTIAPKLGRTVILKHGPHSYHGHTNPVSTGGTRARRSLGVYYYSSQPSLRSIADAEPSVFALDRNGKFAPSAEKTLTDGERTPAKRISAYLRMLTPPIAWNFARYIVRKRKASHSPSGHL